MKSYRDLRAWQLATDVVVTVYEASRGFPTEEKFGITLPVRRASISVAANIAEGYGRRTRGEYLNSLSHANGSQFELETEIIAARRLGYLPDDQLLSKCKHSGRILSKLISSPSIGVGREVDQTEWAIWQPRYTSNQARECLGESERPLNIEPLNH